MPKTFYKLTDLNGNNVYSVYGTVRYEVGKTVEVTVFDTHNDACGKGLHVCEKVDDLYFYKNNKLVTNTKTWEVSVEDEDILASDTEKTRVKKLKVVRELDNSEIYGSNHLELFEFINRIRTLPYENPAKDLDLGWVEQLVHEHLAELGKYAETDAFSGVMVKFINTEKEYRVAWGAASSAAGYAAGYATWHAARDSVRYAARYAASSSAARAAWEVANRAAWGVTRYAARYVAEHAAEDIVANTEARPWMPLIEILALGCVPVPGLVDNEFVIWVP